MVLAAGPLQASQVADNDSGPQKSFIRPGVIETGAAGSLVSVEGVSAGDISLRGGIFTGLLPGLIEVEFSASFMHVSSLDEFSLEGFLGLHRQIGKSRNYFFASFGGGLRYEDIGSFDHTRYTLGIGTGFKCNLVERAGIRVEYQMRRILNDPIANYSEHKIMAGLSIFFRN